MTDAKLLKPSRAKAVTQWKMKPWVQSWALRKSPATAEPWAPVLIVEEEPKASLISCISEY